MGQQESRDRPLAALIAVAEYANYQELPRAKVAAERLGQVLGAGGYMLADPTFLSGGAYGELGPRLDTWFNTAPDRSVLFVYWTGHGEVRGSKHYLVCANSPPRMSLSPLNALETDALGAIIASSKAEKVLLIVDTCYSGAGAISAVEAFNDLMRTFPPVPGRSRALSIIAVSHALERAEETVFVDRLLQVLTEPAHELPWTDNSQFLRADQIASAVQQRLTDDGIDASLVTYSVGLEYDFILNPRFTPGLPEQTAEQALARAKAERWKADLFIGRNRLLDQLNDWLRASSGSMVVLTGPPGSGKSAVVRKLAGESGTEAGMETQRQQPGPDIRFDVILNAKGQTAEQLARVLAAGLQLNLPALGLDFKQFTTSIGTMNRPIRVAIDGLDEAAPGENLSIVHQILRPLSSLPNVWTLIGTRRRVDGTPEALDEAERHPQLRELFGDAPVIIDLAAQEDATRDITDYVTARLSPVQAKVGASRVEKAATDVAKRAEGNFLFASVVSRSYLDYPDLIGEALPKSATDAFELDLLARFPSHQIDHVKDLLATLAWSEGAGLPRSLWAQAATLLSSRSYADSDIAWLLGNAAFLVLEAHATTSGVQQTVYRLFHQELADHLRKRWGAEADGRVLKGLVGELRGDQWFGVDPYLRRHLPVHAARAGLLESYLLDPGFLAVVEPEALNAKLARIAGREARDVASVYRRVADRLIDLNPIERMPLIHMTALMNRYGFEKDWKLSELCGWETVWANTRPSSEHLVLRRTERGLSSMALCHGESFSMIALGLDDGAIEFINLSELDRSWEMPEAHLVPVDALSFAWLGSKPLVISAASDGRVGIFDPLEQHPVTSIQNENRWYEYYQSEGSTGHRGASVGLGVAQGDGRTHIVAGPFDQTDSGGDIFCWDLSNLEKVGHVRVDTDASHVFAVAPVAADVHVFIGRGRAIDRLNLTTGERLLEFCPGHDASVSAMALDWIGPELVLISGDQAGVVRRWNALTGEAVGSPMNGKGPVQSLSFAFLDRTFIAIGADNQLFMRDLATGFVAAGPLEGHSGKVLSARAVFDAKANHLVSASSDKTVRSWSLEALTNFIPVFDAYGALEMLKVEVWSPGGKPTVKPLARDLIAVADTGTAAGFGPEYDFVAKTRWGGEEVHVELADEAGGFRERTFFLPAEELTCATVGGLRIVAKRTTGSSIKIIEAESGASYGVGEVEIVSYWGPTGTVLIAVGEQLFLIVTEPESACAFRLTDGKMFDLTYGLGASVEAAATIAGEAFLAMTVEGGISFGRLVLDGDELRYDDHSHEGAFSDAIAFGTGESGPYLVAVSNGGTVMRFDPLNGNLLTAVRVGETIERIWCPQPGQCLIQADSGTILIAYRDAIPAEIR